MLLPMRRAFVVLATALLAGACAVGDALRPTVEENACYASGQVVAETLAALTGEALPDECWALLDTTAISYVSAGDMPCTSDDGRVIGCAMNPPQPRILLLAGVENHKLVDISAHEWLHLLVGCATGDSDPGHADPLLWGVGLDAVLGLSLASSPTGPCLDTTPSP
jgi:hypothetical protein